MLTESEYIGLAQAELRMLVTALDRLDADAIDCELQDDILTIELGDEAPYVVNSHRAARQIWMAADHTAWHFDWMPEQREWIAHKTGDELWATVRRVLTPKLGAQEIESAVVRPQM